MVSPPMPSWAVPPLTREQFWNLGFEVNFPSWYASVQLALIGVLMLSFAWVSAQRRATVVLACAGLLFLFLSLDETAMLHENFAVTLATLPGDRRETALYLTGPWMLIVAPVFLAAMALAAYIGRQLLRGRRKVQLLYAAGLTVYVASFAGVELLLNFAAGAQARVLLIEETGEMVGATLLLWATYELVHSHGIRFSARNSASREVT